MNCKPGDLAVIVRSTLGNTGKIVRVLRASHGNCLTVGESYEVKGERWIRDSQEFKWIVESQGAPLNCSNGRRVMTRPFSDRNLRPIRDPGDDAQDETLEWLPVPSKKLETA